MHCLFASLALCTTLSGTAFADGPTVVAVDPPAAPPPLVAAQDWSGSYVGLSYGKTAAHITFPSGPFDFEDGNLAGIHAGYLGQRGTLVYGAERAYASVSDSEIVGLPLDRMTYSLELKARVGVAANRALFYGVLGDARSTTRTPPSRPPETSIWTGSPVVLAPNSPSPNV